MVKKPAQALERVTVMDKKYEEIISLPHHTSSTRSHMSSHDRAAQFAPFAALSGHDAAIKETERQVEEKMNKR